MRLRIAGVKRAAPPDNPISRCLRGERLAPGESLRSAELEGDVLGGAAGEIPSAAECAGHEIAQRLADGDVAGHGFGPRGIVDAAGVALGHHVFAVRSPSTSPGTATRQRSASWDTCI